MRDPRKGGRRQFREGGGEGKNKYDEKMKFTKTIKNLIPLLHIKKKNNIYQNMTSRLSPRKKIHYLFNQTSLYLLFPCHVHFFIL